MHDLEPYRPVSSMPPAIRDLSVAMDDVPDPELLGDQLRTALGDDADAIESIEVLDVTPGVERTLTAAEANQLRDRIYAQIHAGTVHHWACGDVRQGRGSPGTARGR